MTDPSLDLKTAVIVEDDPDIRHLLREVLEAAGFSTVSVGNGIDGVRAVMSYRPLITTLDVNMPGIDGFEAARRIRSQSDTYIIMLTGLEDEADVVLGLGSGADEYIIKPFRPREFRARIDAMLRRPRQGAPAPAAPRQDSVGPSFPGGRNTSRGAQPPGYDGDSGWGVAPAVGEGTDGSHRNGYDAPRPEIAQTPGDPATYRLPPGADAPPQWNAAEPERPAPGTDIERATHGGAVELAGPSVMTHRDLQVNPDSRVVVVGGDQLELTRTEFDLLATLMESKRRVRSKADLTLVLRGESYVTSYFVGEADKRAIEAHMTNLRRKLGDNPNNPRYIETVRGVGYRMTSELTASN
ncbi:MAG: two-component system response regulator [Microbacterium sp.]|uniref:response regulator transcription factor n=1 Tax=Microbacterium TaxID=33882 RepID=UPI000C3B553B|nr:MULTISPECIES: response regulator transcription factor [Microbacterium]MAB19456.1 two-component system response regulator [Microbacterium sp.]MAY51333.1 two-component system response regulator [Microbacterium sp.]HBS74987.1 two-component system response regulator [Microbacterium sp.]|tara:strand:+ start:18227 stop:19288 length:1062 start_codon:yes stop_codon:yes gene_type:complete